MIMWELNKIHQLTFEVKYSQFFVEPVNAEKAKNW